MIRLWAVVGWLADFDWVNPNGKAEEEQLHRHQVGNELGKKEKQEAAAVAGGQSQGEWWEILERWEGTRSCGALLA